MWQDFKFKIPEDQQKFVVPLNRDTEKLYYNQRIIMDAPVLTEPRTWQITKVNRLSSNGLAVITLAQDLFDKNKDYIETDPNTGEVIGMWADYWSSTVEPNEPKGKTEYSEILINSSAPIIKTGGNERILTAVYYDRSKQPVPKNSYTWDLKIDGKEPLSNLFTVTYPNTDSTLSDDQIKISFADDDTYLHKNLDVECIADGEKAQLQIAVTGL